MVRDDQVAERGPRAGHYAVVEMRSIIATPPAIGTDLRVAVPATSRWCVKALNAILNTDAVAGNRVPYLQIQDQAGNPLYTSPPTGNQVANTIIGYSGGAGCAGRSFGAYTSFPLPVDTILLPNWSIGFVTIGLDAGDQWAPAALLVKEWLQF